MSHWTRETLPGWLVARGWKLKADHTHSDIEKALEASDGGAGWRRGGKESFVHRYAVAERA